MFKNIELKTIYQDRKLAMTLEYKNLIPASFFIAPIDTLIKFFFPNGMKLHN